MFWGWSVQLPVWSDTHAPLQSPERAVHARSGSQGQCALRHPAVHEGWRLVDIHQKTRCGEKPAIQNNVNTLLCERWHIQSSSNNNSLNSFFLLVDNNIPWSYQLWATNSRWHGLLSCSELRSQRSGCQKLHACIQILIILKGFISYSHIHNSLSRSIWSSGLNMYRMGPTWPDLL